jgi:predicted  nucleic acid-binding Zn-ribbon protein
MTILGKRKSLWFRLEGVNYYLRSHFLGSRGHTEMPDRVLVDRKEFQALVAESQELVQRYQKRVQELDSLRNLNRDLEEKLRLAEQKISSLEQNAATEVQDGDGALRKAREMMARLMKETDRQISQ